MPYQTFTKPGFQIMGTEVRTSNNQAEDDIPRHWDAFYRDNIQAKIPHQTTGEVLGVYCKYDGDHTQPYSLIIGCEVDEIDEVPEGLVSHSMPGTEYAVYTAKGEFPDALIRTWQEIWASDLKRSFTSDFELYGASFQPPENEVNIYIALAGQS